MDAAIILSTVPDETLARAISTELVRDRYVACVNIVPGVTSVYQWNNETTIDSEFLLIIKTTQDKIEAVEVRLRELHPYEIPEFVVIKPTKVAESYLSWLSASTR